MQEKSKKRKTSKEYLEEHELFVGELRAGTSSLEIMDALGLTKVQFEKHLLDALTRKEITEISPRHETVRLKTLPLQLQRLFVGLSEKTLIKIEQDNGKVILSPLVDK